MRQRRLKPDYKDTWHHCYNRTVGTTNDRPLDDVDKEVFVRILRRVCRLYAVRLVSYQVMSNHFHLLLHAPAQVPSEEETCRRFAAFHNGKRFLTPGSQGVLRWQGRLRDVSWFMRHLEHLFTCWYNRSRPVRRRGSLWAGRFKNTVLESGAAVRACWIYIECNPLRAGMVADPADYRFCSCGIWAQSGRHPFEDHVRTFLIPALRGASRITDLPGLQQLLREEIARRTEAEGPGSPTFSTSSHRRMRHWVDGLIIGSEVFIRNTMSRIRPEAEVSKHRLARSSDKPVLETSALYCWRRLRVTDN